MEKTNKAKKPSWFKELKAEFNRIIWPTKERIAKETAVVVICAIIIGVIVAVLDVGIQCCCKQDYPYTHRKHPAYTYKNQRQG